MRNLNRSSLQHVSLASLRAGASGGEVDSRSVKFVPTQTPRCYYRTVTAGIVASVVCLPADRGRVSGLLCSSAASEPAGVH